MKQQRHKIWEGIGNCTVVIGIKSFELMKCFM